MMKKLTIFALIMFLGLFVFCSCNNKKDEAPEGLQVIKKSEADGYIFYGPEGWTVANTDDVAAAKVFATSKERPSISFTEADMPVGTIPEYFADALGEFPKAIADTMTIVLRDEVCLFGNANGQAYKYVYTYKYDELDVACMQILLTHDNRFYIFTYTSFGDVNNEGSLYRRYLEKVNLSVDNFTFTERSDDESKPNYEKDSDGYNLVSDATVAKFSLYLPDGYDVVFSSGFVKAKISEVANISLTRATDVNVGILDYLKARKTKLGTFTTDFQDVSLTFAMQFNAENPAFADFGCTPVTNSELKFGNLGQNIVAYEYKYTFNGQVYHVYQMMGVDSHNGFVFTYTALDSEYEQHFDEIKTILEKVVF